MRRLYRMHDAEPRGVMAVEQDEAHSWNAKGFGIFWTVNTFDGERRIENLKRIDAWAVDMDEGTKDEQRERIHKSPLVPSLIVETKRGYQVYWAAKDGKPEHWNALVLHRLVPFFGADKNARDLARILRVPGYYHMKNPKEPFLVREVFRRRVSYRELELARAFPDMHVPELPRLPQSEPRQFAQDGFWERVSSLDCAEGLARLSGHPAVNGEVYTLRRPRANGSRNLLVNGKGTSCWIDANGKIGSLSQGGPTIGNWLYWFCRDWKRVAAVLKDLYPGLEAK